MAKKFDIVEYYPNPSGKKRKRVKKYVFSSKTGTGKMFYKNGALKYKGGMTSDGFPSGKGTLKIPTPPIFDSISAYRQVIMDVIGDSVMIDGKIHTTGYSVVFNKSNSKQCLVCQGTFINGCPKKVSMKDSSTSKSGSIELDDNGYSINEQISCHDNGNMEIVQKYKEGGKVVIQRIYNRNGILESTLEANDDDTATTKLFGPDGVLISERSVPFNQKPQCYFYDILNA